MAAILSLSPNPPITTSPSLHSTFKGNLGNSRPNPFHIIHVRTKQKHLRTQKRTRSLVIVNQAAKTQVLVTASMSGFGWTAWDLSQVQERKGRGISAGQGGSCGFGMRGQKSRSGPGVRKGFEGGQMPLYRLIPILRGLPEIFGEREVNVKLSFRARAFSASAKEKLEAVGCTLTVLPGRRSGVKPFVVKNLARSDEYFARGLQQQHHLSQSSSA